MHYIAWVENLVFIVCFDNINSLLLCWRMIYCKITINKINSLFVVFREMTRVVGHDIKEYIHIKIFPLNARLTTGCLSPKCFHLILIWTSFRASGQIDLLLRPLTSVRSCPHRVFCLRICIMWFTVCTCFLIKPVANISFVMSVRVYVRLSTLSSSVPTGRLFAKILYRGDFY